SRPAGQLLARFPPNHAIDPVSKNLVAVGERETRNGLTGCILQFDSDRSAAARAVVELEPAPAELDGTGGELSFAGGWACDRDETIKPQAGTPQPGLGRPKELRVIDRELGRPRLHHTLADDRVAIDPVALIQTG